jgi:hypothetical protein
MPVTDKRRATDREWSDCCYKCRKPFGNDLSYAVLWDKSDKRAGIVGFLCKECSDDPSLVNTTKEVVGP